MIIKIRGTSGSGKTILFDSSWNESTLTGRRRTEVAKRLLISMTRWPLELADVAARGRCDLNARV
jgi:hypothetical protein